MNLTIIKFGSLVWKNEKGQLHREEGPAVIYPTGRIEYWLNHDFHRLDGPAIIWPDGIKSYYIHGKKYIKEEYYDKVEEL